MTKTVEKIGKYPSSYAYYKMILYIYCDDLIENEPIPTYCEVLVNQYSDL